MTQASASTPLTQSHTEPAWSRSVHTVVLGSIMITLSVWLINFNKWLMQADRFPFAVPLVLIHMIFGTVFALVLKCMLPRLFPSLTSETERVAIDRDFILRGLFPVALVFAGALVLGNLAYTKLSLSFLQMLKETNLIWTYLLTVVMAMEVFKWTSVKLIIIAMVAMVMTIRGEINFVFAGLVMQFGAIFCEAIRVVLQTALMSGKKLDPLSFVLCICPMCGLVLGFASLLLAHLPAEYAIQGMTLPSVEQLKVWAPWLVADSLLAFLLNVSIATLLKFSGPMAYLMCQIVKDIVAVLGGIFALHEVVSRLQVIGFMTQLLVVFLWSMAKSFPNEFDSGIGRGCFFLVSAEGPFRTAPKAAVMQDGKQVFKV